MKREDYLIKGASGNSYVFNVCLLEGSVHCAEDRFDSLPGVFILAERTENPDAGEVVYKSVYLGVTDNVKAKLNEALVGILLINSNINCICYIHESDELRRLDIGKDVAAANRFLYITGIDGPQPYFGLR